MKEPRKEKYGSVSERREHGTYHSLVSEIRATNPDCDFLWLDDKSFTTLQQHVAPSNQRQDMTLRKAIPPEARMALF